jgi:uroporphyrin-III C-methyltransferase / precorrin-2 dehydrogenase / sirohydrochlorin ferrochelatase
MRGHADPMPAMPEAVMVEDTSGSPRGLRRREERLGVFPVFLKVEGARAVVVGDGAEALAKARLLTESRIDVQLVAPAPETALAAFVIQSGIRHIARPYESRQIEGAVMVFAASGSPELDRQVVADARRLRIPANAVDQPELCDFYTPALVNRAPVAVAIGSEGSGPVLTRMIRSSIEAMLPQALGTLARLASDYRPAAERVVPQGAPRRLFWRNFFSGPVASAVYRGEIAAARRHIFALLREEAGSTGHVAIVGAGPGAADLLTLRAQRLLQEADVIFYDNLVPEAVVAMGRRDARRICVGKVKGLHTTAQKDIESALIAEARSGRRVVRLKGGDPLIFGRAGEEMAALRENGIAFEVVPGITAALAAAAQAQVPLTLRGVASALIFVTGHDTRSRTLPGWAGLALSGATIAVYMGRTVAAKVANQLMDAGLAADTPVVIVESASLPDTGFEAGKLSDLSRLAPGRERVRPALVLVGKALAQADLSAAAPIVAGGPAKAIAA